MVGQPPRPPSSAAAVRPTDDPRVKEQREMGTRKPHQYGQPAPLFHPSLCVKGQWFPNHPPSFERRQCSLSITLTVNLCVHLGRTGLVKH